MVRRRCLAWLALPIMIGVASGTPTCPVALPFDWVQPAMAFPWHGRTQIWSFTRVFPKQKLILCTVPGAGSTPIRTIINAIAVALSGGTLNFTETTPHAEMREAWWLHSLESLPTEQIERIACDPSWKRYAFVRNPYVRILSKFQDKIVRHSRDRKPGRQALIEIREPAQRADGLNFTNFTARLAAVAEIQDELLGKHQSHHFRRKHSASKHAHAESEYVDEHFRVMSNFCGMRHIPYEWIRYEELRAGMGKVVEKLGIRQHPDVAAQIGKIRPHDDCAEAERLGAVFTDVDKQRVRAYFAEDFKRFGYSDVFPTCGAPAGRVHEAAPKTVAPIPAA